MGFSQRIRGAVRRSTIMMIAVLCAGCVGQYSIVVTNSTGELIRDAAVVYGDFRSVIGSMSPGVTAAHRFVPAPLPGRATVEWRTPDKVQHSKEVEVGSLLPPAFFGSIHFEIGPGEQVLVRAERGL